MPTANEVEAMTGQPVRFESVAAQLHRWYEVSAFRVGDPLARQVAVLFADISARKQAQAADSEANRRKDAFLATLAHELRNPLAPLRTSLHVLTLTDEPQTVKRLHDIMERQVDQLSRLVDDLMEVSRITRGQIELRLEPVDLATVVRNAVETSRPQIEHSGQSLSITLPHLPLHVLADAVRLAQVVTNLLTNARKYTPSGTTITVSATPGGFAVHDDGPGFPPGLAEHAFERFARGDAARTRGDAGGAGLGLALVQAIVTAHGGTVALRSQPGSTTVTVSLPT